MARHWFSGKRSQRVGVLVATAALLVLAPVGAMLSTSTPAWAAGTFANSRIADLALTKVGSKGGECWTFVQNMILQAGGRNISTSTSNPNYFTHLQAAGGVPVATAGALTKGDVVQIGQGVHTFIIVGRISGNRFDVVDSNHDLKGTVMRYARNVVLDANTKAFRFGTVGSPTPPEPSRPVFTVMNTSEQPPDGVWFRDNPNVSSPRLNGYGVYRGDRVQLQCFTWGPVIGGYANRLWYRSANLTRPSAPGRANVGWLNAHYVNDGKATNVVDAGVPAC